MPSWPEHLFDKIVDAIAFSAGALLVRMKPDYANIFLWVVGMVTIPCYWG